MIPKVTIKSPAECQDITEVRNEIDRIDRLVVELISERFEYVKQVVKFKEKTAGSIEAPVRRAAMLKQRRAWAEELGLGPDAIECIFDRLVQYFIEEEKLIAKV